MARSRVILPEDADPPGQKMGIATYDNGTETVAAPETTLVAADGGQIGGDAANGLDVDVTRSVLPTGASTEATLALIKAKTDNLDVALSTRTKPADAQHAIIDSGAVTANIGTTNGLALDGTDGTSPPAVLGSGTGIRGWLRSIYEKLTGSIAVTGTFWQTTQPVSLASVPSHAVTNAGTFATQAAQSGTWNITNVSGTVSLPTGASTLAEQQTQTTSLQLIDDVVVAEDVASADADKGVRILAVRKATPANTSNTDGDYEFLQVSAGRLWTSSTIDTALPTGSNVIGALTANQSVNNAQVAGVAVSTGNGVSGTGVQRVTLASDSTGQVALAAGTNAIGKLTANSGVVIGDVNDIPPTLTKGTQGSTGFSVQNLTDAGRTFLGFTAQNVTAGTSGTEAMASFSQNKGNTVTASVTSYTVTSGKRFRMTCLQIAITAQAATVTRLLANIRCNTAGATTTSSNLVAGFDIGGPAVSGQTAYETIPLNEAFEFLGDGTLTIGVSFNPTWTTTAAKVSVTLYGYEY